RARALSDVMDEEDRHVEIALHLAKRSEEPRDLACRVLVDRVKTHQGIEEEEARPELGEGGAQALEILTSIEPEARDRDHVEIGIKKLDLAGARDRLDALTDERKRILCEVDERESGILDWEVSKRGAATCNAERHVEPEPGFTGFRGATEDTNGLTRPETVDEEASRLVLARHGRDVENRQRGGCRL